MRKKLLSILLTLAMLLCMLPAGFAADIEIVDEPVGADAPGSPLDEIVDEPVGADALDAPLAEGNIVASGQCGENLFWTLDEAGTLTITGTGDMWDSIGAQGYGGAWSAYGAQIRTVIIEDGATSIGAESFKNCDQITSVVIPDSLLTIDNQAFLNCSALENLSLGEGIIGIGYESFANCSSLKSIILPDSLNSLGLGAFRSCGALTEVSFGSGLTTISGSAFADCSSLETVAIPQNVTNIHAGAFSSCEKLIAIHVAEENPNYKSIDGVLFSKDGTELLCCPAGKSGQYQIPDGVTTIAEMAFNNCDKLTDVTIPEGVTNISRIAFEYCDGLTELTIPESVATIETNAFFSCTGLERILVAEENPTYQSVDGVLFNFNGQLLLCCPAGRSGEYVVPDMVTKIYQAAFRSCSKLTAIILGSNVNTIGEAAFFECSALTSMTIPESVYSIDGYAFSGCTSLESVTLDSIANIWYMAFYDCSSLSSITFYGNAPRIQENSFADVTATAYYPAFDLSWTEDVRQDYGGTITWVAETGDGLPIDEEHFPDETFRGYVAEEFDDDGDGYLNDEEITAITEIDVSMMGISSLHGIEYFPELTSLTCSMNSLTELDVTHNPALIWLDCLDNELTKLDLSHNSKLEMLDCSFNSLTALDLTHNPALTSIDCSENAITALDVTHNPALEGLFCYGNEIAALDLSGNAELIVLDCSTNALTELDLSGNSGLVMLECYGNDIAELDLSPCPTLVDIVTNGTYEQKPNYDSYSKDSYFVHVDPATTLITEPQPGDGFTITVTDYTNGAAQTSLDLDAKYSGSVTFTVTSTDDKAVLVAVKNSDDDDASYQVAKCVTEGGVHTFTITVKANTTVALAFKGDADLDGIIEGLDGTMIKRVALETFTYDTKLKELVSDIDSNGIIAALEGTMVCRAALETYTLPWSNP